MNSRIVHRACTLLAAILWTLSLSTMTFSLDGSPNQLAEVALWLALVAIVPTAHLVMEFTVTRSREALLAELDAMIGRHRARLVDDVLEVVGRVDAERALKHIGGEHR